MGSFATTGLLFHALLLLFSTLICYTRADGLLGFDDGLSSSLVEILKKDTCCMRRFRTKTIEQTHFQNDIRYNCKATVRQAYCGGNCQTTSTYNSGIMRLDSRFRPIGWADEPSATIAKKVCLIKEPVTQTYTMLCRAERGCCQDVAQEEITITVTVNEPASGDNGCECTPQLTATPIFPCALRYNYQYVYFVAWPWRCRSFVPIYIPYCSGCCSGYQDYYFMLSPFWRRINKKYCQCCGGTSYGIRKVGVYCWQLFDFTDAQRDDATVTIFTVDADGNSRAVTEDEYNRAGFKFETVYIYYIRTCGCNNQNC